MKLKLYRKVNRLFGETWLLENERGDTFPVLASREQAMRLAEFFGAEIVEIIINS